MLARDALTDLRLGIWTGGPIRRRVPDAAARNVHYEPLRYAAIRALQARLRLAPDDVVCDLGCGKGRLICWLSRSVLTKVIGVDLDRDLTTFAEANVRRLRKRRSPVEIRCEDATRSRFDGINKFIMFNPFGESVMKDVVDSIRKSVASDPREIHIVYFSPVHARVLDESGFLETCDEFDFAYENVAESVKIYRSIAASTRSQSDLNVILRRRRAGS